MADNPCVAHDLFGEQYVFFTEGLGVYFVTRVDGDEERMGEDPPQPPLGRHTPVHAFDQFVEGGRIAVIISGQGVICVTLLDGEGNRVEVCNACDGAPGAWVWPAEEE